MARNDEHQREIVRNKLHTSIVVTAGAGSGKTRELVSRYLNLIQNNENPEMPQQILALTFTNKAAAEMKKRIRKEFSEEGIIGTEAGSLDIGTELSFAPVMTFHAFCTMLLREFAVEARVDPDFRIIEDSERKQLEDRVFSDLLSHPHDEKERDALINILAIYGKTSLKKILCGLSEHRDNCHGVYLFFKQDRSSILTQWQAFLDPVREQAVREFFADETITHTLYIVKHAGYGVDPSDKAVQHFDSIRSAIEKITPDTPHAELTQAIIAILSQRLGNSGSKKLWGEEELQETKAVYKILRGRLEKLLPYLQLTIDPDAAQTDITLEVVEDLLIVAKGYFSRLNLEKQKAGALDFTDIISKTKNFLEQNPEIVAREIRKRYRYIFIDEFQDTDPAQFEIISSIIGTLDENCKGLFIVGDPNQSIYLFRNADVTQFKSVKSIISNDCAGEVLHFSVCFRSTPEIIGCVNHVFSHIFATDEKPWEFVHTPTIVSDTRSTDSGSVQVLLAGDIESGDNIEKAKKKEGKLIAETILAHLQTHKNSRPGDIAILIEKRTHLIAYLSALKAAGLPFIVGKGIGFYSRPEVWDLYSVLSFICTPHDDCALLAVLRSPYICLSDRTITILSLRLQGLCLWDRMCQAAIPRQEEERKEMESLFGEEYSRVISAQERLAEWVQLGWTRPLQILIHAVLQSSQIFTLYAALDDGEQKIANVKKLIEIILEHSTDAGYGIIQAVEGIKGSVQAEETEGEAERTREDAISVMTVHAAKGLEFPVVILAGLSDGKTGDYPPLHIGTEPEEFGIKVPDPDADYEVRETPIYTALRLLREEKELAESKRLLYVGMTRARDHLILSGTRPKRKFPAIADGTSKMDWICTVLNIDPQLQSPPPVAFDGNEGHIIVPVIVNSEEDEDFENEQISQVYEKNEIKRHSKIIIPHKSGHIVKNTALKDENIRKNEIQIQISSLKKQKAPKEEKRDERREKDQDSQIDIPGTEHLHSDQLGTLIHEIFSGVPATRVLQRYGIVDEEAVRVSQGHYEKFKTLPILQTVYEEYMELSCNLPIVLPTSKIKVNLLGKIDILCKTANGWIIIDYKTGKVNSNEFQPVLDAYRRAAERLVKEPVVAYLYLVSSHTLLLNEKMDEEEFLSLIAAKVRQLFS